MVSYLYSIIYITPLSLEYDGAHGAAPQLLHIALSMVERSNLHK